MIIRENWDPRAIMFANDDMAIAALEYINWEQPEFRNRYRITGFDNVINAGLTNPSLTTVDQPMGELIEKALEMASLPKEERVSLTVAAKPVIRRSCGCPNEASLPAPFRALYHNSNKLIDYLYAGSLDEMYVSLTHLLTDFEISHMFILLYEPEANPPGYEGKIPLYSRLAFSWREGKRVAGEDRELHKSDEALYKAVATESPFSYVVNPLFIEKTHYGLMICETKIGFEEEIEVIKGLIRYTIKIQLLMDEKEKLTGLLPICSACHSIRDDEGYWSRVEEYVSRRSDAHFSHTLCPDCITRIYGKEMLDQIEDSSGSKG